MSKELKGIKQPAAHEPLWRYMNFEKFINILVTGSLFFTRADKYDDKFEGYIPEAIMRYYGSPDIRIDRALREYIMCNCWHSGKQESMGMWDKYHIRNSGIAIKTTMENLKNCLPDTPNIFIGKVDYDVGSIENQNQIEVPEDLSIEHLLDYLYFYKRKPFAYEREVRAIIDITSIPRDVTYTFGIPLEIDVKTLIGKDSEVIVSPHADEWITETVELIVERCGFQFTVTPSKLLDPAS
ncbi:MAG: DUF2971 domain-containing protein [Gemmatimonadota bacterium]|nr:DUF2971 domain-containing protein [Gemmatimonadota bacterium]